MLHLKRTWFLFLKDMMMALVKFNSVVNFFFIFSLLHFQAHLLPNFKFDWPISLHNHSFCTCSSTLQATAELMIIIAPTCTCMSYMPICELISFTFVPGCKITEIYPYQWWAL